MCVCCLSVDELYPGRLYGTLDSGFNSVDSGDKRWSGNEVRCSHTHTHKTPAGVDILRVCVCFQPSEELSELSVRVAEMSRDQRSRGGGALLANGTREWLPEHQPPSDKT